MFNEPNEQMEELLKDDSSIERSPKLSEIVMVKILSINDKNIIVGLGSKKDGIIPKSEANLEQGQKLLEVYNVGDEVKAKVIKKDDGEGNVLLSISKAEASKGYEGLAKSLEDKTPVEVKVVKIVNKGVIAQYGEDISGFIPLSQLSDRFIKSAEEYYGKTLSVIVINLDVEENKIIFSYREFLLRQKEEIFKNLCSQINRGDIISGKIMRFTPFGAFVDIGGIDGLLHISEMSWSKINNPESLFSLGDTINVVVLEINEEEKRISLGYKQTQPEPFKQICEKYKVGDTIKGKVVQIKTYGVFVSIEKGIDGLVHISEVADGIVNISDHVKVGQEVDVKIIELNEDEKRISLSLKGSNSGNSQVNTNDTAQNESASTAESNDASTNASNDESNAESNDTSTETSSEEDIKKEDIVDENTASSEENDKENEMPDPNEIPVNSEPSNKDNDPENEMPDPTNIDAPHSDPTKDPENEMPKTE